MTTPPNTDWADLDARLSRIELHAERTDKRLERGDERLERGDERMGRIEDAIAKNTELTQTIADWFATGKTVIKVGSGLGSFAGWAAKLISFVAAVWGLVYAATHGGAKPPGH